MEHDPKEQQLKSFFTEDKERYTFYFDLDPQNNPTKIEVYMRASTLMEQALLLAIDTLNQKLATMGVSLRKDLSLFKPRLTGKHFKPKTDLPALSLYQKICDLKVTEIAVQCLNRQQALLKAGSKTTASTQQAVAIEKHNDDPKAGGVADLSSGLAKVELGEKQPQSSIDGK